MFKGFKKLFTKKETKPPYTEFKLTQEGDFCLIEDLVTNEKIIIDYPPDIQLKDINLELLQELFRNHRNN